MNGRSGGRGIGARCRGLSYLEVVATVAILAILTGMVLPLAKHTRTRVREAELRRALHQIRHAIDEHRRANEEHRHVNADPEHAGCPRDLETLVKGITLP